eukprot:scaffold15555_cov180-Amphora_coffeaeformis.AAC.8
MCWYAVGVMAGLQVFIASGYCGSIHGCHLHRSGIGKSRSSSSQCPGADTDDVDYDPNFDNVPTQRN